VQNIIRAPTISYVLAAVQVHGRDDFPRSFGQVDKPLCVFLHVVDDDDRHGRVHDHVVFPIQAVSRRDFVYPEHELGLDFQGRRRAEKHVRGHCRAGFEEFFFSLNETVYEYMTHVSVGVMGCTKRRCFIPFAKFFKAAQ